MLPKFGINSEFVGAAFALIVIFNTSETALVDAEQRFMLRASARLRAA
jgi:hypothetical protein